MTIATAYEVHPLAHLLPEMREGEYAELREDIAANGLHEAITLYEGRILDGRHRYRACEEIGLWPHFTTYDGAAPAAYVLSLNVKRRQLTPSQRAMLATDFLPHLREEAKARQAHGMTAPGRPLERFSANDEKRSEPKNSHERAATEVGVGTSLVTRANRVKESSPELAEHVRQGDLTVNAAYERVTGRPTNGTAVRELAQNITRDGSRRRPATQLVENVVGMVEGLPAALEQIDVQSAVASPDAPLADWDKRLTGAIVALDRLRKQIRGANS